MTLHHVGIEVEPADLERSIEFWRLLGFALVEPPAALADSSTWLEKEGSQVHLMHVGSPTVPTQGHTAVVTPKLEETATALRDRGFDLQPKRERWGAPRALAIAPGGHRVELMAAPPRSAPQIG